jgi:subtilisin family serine protease
MIRTAKAVSFGTAALALAFALCAGPSETASARAEAGKSRAVGVKISPLDLQYVLALRGATPSTLPPGASLPVSGPSAYYWLQIEFESPAARLRFRPPEGVTLFHEFERFADAFLDLRFARALEDLQALEGIVWIDVQKSEIRVPAPPVAITTREKARGAEKIVRGGISGLTGKGVIVAVIDNGIDFRHKDFIRQGPDGKPVSRILAYWDVLSSPRPGEKLGSRSPFSYPNGAPIGVVYSQDELTEELRNPTGKVPVTGAHGTPCAGIAAGNGTARSDRRYTGVAPDADLIAVRVGFDRAFTHDFMVGAICSWLDEKAGERPMVVSCSFGNTQKGGRDGCLVWERQLDARFRPDRKGRTICIAAGNSAEGGSNHAEVWFQGENNKGTLGWNGSLGARGRVAFYVDTDDPEDVVVRVSGSPAATVHRYVHPLSRSLVVEVGQGANGQAELWSRSRTKRRADAYLDLAPGSFRGQSRIGLVSTPGSMINAITVGSYDFNAVDDRGGTPRALFDHTRFRPLRLGDISAYSSPGYNRTGVVKPVIAAPGQWFIAPSQRGARGATGAAGEEYLLFNGTSAATPYVAGVVALLMQKNPNLTVGQIKRLLQEHATTDRTSAVVGRTPNPHWGHGKLDYRAIQAIVKAVP